MALKVQVLWYRESLLMLLSAQREVASDWHCWSPLKSCLLPMVIMTTSVTKMWRFNCLIFLQLWNPLVHIKRLGQEIPPTACISWWKSHDSDHKISYFQILGSVRPCTKSGCRHVLDFLDLIKRTALLEICNVWLLFSSLIT